MTKTHYLSEFNKDSLRGYLLACCDQIDEMIANDVLPKNDMAKKFSDKVREYLALTMATVIVRNNTPQWTLYSGNSELRFCTLCGAQIDSGIHVCWQHQSTDINTP